MKICCIIETTYQLINAINLLTNDKEFENAEVDLFVRNHNFAYSDEYCTTLRQLGVFHEVNNFTQNVHFSKSNLINHFKHFRQYFSVNRTLSQLIGNGYKFNAKKYDIILTPNGCVFFKMVMFGNKNAHIYGYEDGLLSYSDSGWITSDISNLSKRIMKLLGRGTSFLPERLYVYRPELCHFNWNVVVNKLPPVENTINKPNNILKSVFGDSVCDYRSTRIVFLSQPIHNATTEAITKCMEDYPFICRYHPRDDVTLDYGGITDRSSSQWELICADSITDDHILIGACSTAQSSPKWLFNKEPYLIFTYPMYEKFAYDNFAQKCASLVAEIKESYSDSDKVLVVDSNQELAEKLLFLTEKLK